VRYSSIFRLFSDQVNTLIVSGRKLWTIQKV
jgi:hypothetical protein